MSLSVISLITWICAAGCGLYLVSIWLIEYDRDFQKSARTRLPPAVLAGHVTLAGGGLIIWGVWFVDWSQNLVLAAALALLGAATLGTIMAIRWVGVYREFRSVKRAAAEPEPIPPPAITSRLAGGRAGGATSRQVATLARPVQMGPPERNFPLPVVVAHGAFAVATLTMVLLILFRVAS
jgi:hypothetical protein